MLSGFFHYPERFLHHLIRKNEGRVHKILSLLHANMAFEIGLEEVKAAFLYMPSRRASSTAGLELG